MKKANLRKIFKNKRKDYFYFCNNNNEFLNKKTLDFILANEIGNVHVYMSSEKHLELDTMELVKTLWKNNIVVVTSVSNFINNTMEHYELKPNTKLVVNAYGIPEPQNATVFNVVNIQMVLTPLLCFDIQGYRVGYGRGFYDRFFADCPSTVIKFGWSVFDPVEKIDDVDVLDCPLDYVLTPNQLYTFSTT